jgi:hypothetical protein
LTIFLAIKLFLLFSMTWCNKFSSMARGRFIFHRMITDRPFNVMFPTPRIFQDSSPGLSDWKTRKIQQTGGYHTCPNSTSLLHTWPIQKSRIRPQKHMIQAKVTSEQKNLRVIV